MKLVYKHPLYLILSILVLFCLKSKAQQFPTFSSLEQHNIYINPASVNNSFFNNKVNLRLGLSSRQQWIFSDYRPQTQNFSFEFRGPIESQPLNDQNVFLLTGSSIILDNIGPSRIIKGMGNLGIMILPENKGNNYRNANFGFSAAFNIGASQNSIRTNNIFFFNPNDLINQDQFGKSYFNLDAGIYMFRRYGSKGSGDHVIYVGLSGHNINQSPALTITGQTQNYGIDTRTHWNLMGGWLRSIESGGEYIKLSTWIKYVAGAPISIQIDIRYPLLENFWVSTGISTSQYAGIESTPITILGGWGYNIFRNKHEGQILQINFFLEYSLRKLGPNFGPNLQFQLSYFF